MSDFLILLLPIALILGLVGAKFWRTTLIAVLFWSLIEGVFRKWLLPAYQAPILQIKDLALLGVYMGYALSVKRSLENSERINALTTLLVFQVIYCFVEILNPNLPSRILGLYGFKNYVIYLPLVFVLPEVIDTREKVQRLMFWIAIVTIPLALLGLYQFSQPPTSWVNRYVSHDGTDTVVGMFGRGEGPGDFAGGHARTSSTFSFLGGYTTFLLMAIPVLTSTLFIARALSRQTLVAAAALALAIGATLTTGSRTPVVVLVLMIPLMGLAGGLKGLLRLTTALRLGGLTAIIGIVGLVFFADAASAFMFRAENSDSASMRLLSPVMETLTALDASPMFGIGVGASSNAGGSLVDPSLYWLNVLVEVEPARIMQDLGLPGFLLIYLSKLVLIQVTIKWLIWSRSKLFVAMYLAILAFLIPHIVLFTVNNPTGGLFFWALGGCAVAMYRIEHRERREARTQLAPATNSSFPHHSPHAHA